jgi:hypothetical protein
VIPGANITSGTGSINRSTSKTVIGGASLSGFSVGDGGDQPFSNPATDPPTVTESFSIEANAALPEGDATGETAFFQFLDVINPHPFDVQITYPTPFPGTPMHRDMQRAGRLTHEGQWSRCTLFDINFTPSHMTAAELRDGFMRLSRELYSESFTRYRRDRFKRISRNGRGRHVDHAA